MTDRKWRITIPRWDGEGGFQHYKHRDPIWLRVYTRLHSNDAYLELSTHLRGVLLGLWIEYARGGRDLAVTTATLTRRLNARVTTQDLQRLNQAGFIELSLAQRKQDAPLEQNRADQTSAVSEPSYDDVLGEQHTIAEIIDLEIRRQAANG